MHSVMSAEQLASALARDREFVERAYGAHRTEISRVADAVVNGAVPVREAVLVWATPASPMFLVLCEKFGALATRLDGGAGGVIAPTQRAPVVAYLRVGAVVPAPHLAEPLRRYAVPGHAPLLVYGPTAAHLMDLAYDARQQVLARRTGLAPGKVLRVGGT